MSTGAAFPAIGSPLEQHEGREGQSQQNTGSGIQKFAFLFLVFIIMPFATIVRPDFGIMSQKQPSIVRPSSSSSSPLPPSLPRARNGTGLAMVPWRSRTDADDLNLRLFYQTGSGELRERFWNSALGWSNYSSIIGDSTIIAKDNTPLAHATWGTFGGAREIQLFYLNPDNIICDAIYSGGKWAKGSLGDRSFSAGEHSQLAATVWNHQKGVVVYFQDSDDQVLELVYTGSSNEWARYDAEQLSLKTAKGAGLHAIHFVIGDKPQLRIYTQTDDHAIISKAYNDVWEEAVGLYKSTTTPLGTSIVGTMVNTGSENEGLAMVRVYFVGERGIVREVNYHQISDWNLDPRNLIEGDNNGGSIAAVDWDENNARMIFKKREGGLGEMVLDGKKWDTTDFSL